MLKELQWGETPWDSLSREELLREVQRLYSAVQSARSVLAMLRQEQRTGFWGWRGSGGTALDKAEQCVDRVETVFDRESIYRAFYRYADDLLFDCSQHDIGFGWGLCPVCKITIGRGSDGLPTAGRLCAEYLPKGCPGILRPLTWEDLQPKKEEKSP